MGLSSRVTTQGTSQWRLVARARVIVKGVEVVSAQAGGRGSNAIFVRRHTGDTRASLLLHLWAGVANILLHFYLLQNKKYLPTYLLKYTAAQIIFYILVFTRKRFMIPFNQFGLYITY